MSDIIVLNPFAFGAPIVATAGFVLASGASNTGTLSAPAERNSGDLLVLVLTSADNVSAFGTPTGYTQVEIVGTGGGGQTVVYTRTATATSGDDAGYDMPTGFVRSGRLFVIRKTTATAGQFTITVNDGDPPVNCPADAVTSPGDGIDLMVVIAWPVTGAESFGTPAGFDVGLDVTLENGSNDFRHLAYTRAVGSGSTGTTNVVLTTAGGANRIVHSGRLVFT